MPLPLFIVDAFTDHPFAGNPAAVCLLDAPRDDNWMQQLASEMNLSETAFLLPQPDGHRLRWFTPKLEVDLCGHATLASAHILWETGRLATDQQARFHTRSGLLTVAQTDAGMEMDFPAVQAVECVDEVGLGETLGIVPRLVARSRMDYLVEVDSETTLRGLRPDFSRLANLPVRGTIVTSASSTPGFDFVSRFFAPGVGVNEDPVTGSAHCALGPFWAERLGKTDLRGMQVSTRSGVVGVRVRGERVLLAGQAVTVVRGELAC